MRQNTRIVLAALYIASLNFEFWAPFIEDFSFSKIFAYLYILGLFVTKFSSTRYVEINRCIKLGLFILLPILLSSIIHINNVSSKIIDISFILNFVMFYLMAQHAVEDQRLIPACLLSFSYSSLLEAIFFISGFGVELDVGGRITLFGDNANSIGIKMAISTIWLLNAIFVIDNKKVHKIWHAAMIFPIAGLLIGTGSRTAFVIFIVCFILAFVLRDSSNLFIKLITIAIGAVFVFYIFEYIGEQGVLYERLIDSVEEKSTSGRDVIWTYYLNDLKDSPFLGYGYSGFAEVSLNHFGISFRSPHNSFIEIALYGGILALFFYLLLWLSFIRFAIRIYKMNREYVFILMIIAVFCDALMGQTLNSKLCWAIYSFVIAYYIQLKEKNVIN